MSNKATECKENRKKCICFVASFLFIMTIMWSVSIRNCYAQIYSDKDEDSGITWTYMDYSDGYMLISCDPMPQDGVLVIPSEIKGHVITSIGATGLKNNTELKEIVLPDTITTVSDSAFAGCTSLKKATLSANLTFVPTYLFRDCVSLENVIIPEGVQSIMGDAFYECSSLKKISIPASVQSIIAGSLGIFTHCESLCSIDVNDNNNNYSDNDGVLFNKEGTTLIAYPEGKDASHYTIPSSVSTIYAYAFWAAKFKTISIPGGISKIPDYCFYNATNLTEVKIPDGVTQIGSYAFFNDSSLKKVILPGGLLAIDENAFGFTGFEEIDIPDSVTTIGRSAFSNSRLKRVKLSSSLKKVEDYLFDSSALTEISIPDSVATIGVNPFRYTASLEYVYIPASVTKINDLSNPGDPSGMLFNGSNPDVKIYGESGSYFATYIQSNVYVTINNFTVATREEYDKIVAEALGETGSPGTDPPDDDNPGGQSGGTDPGESKKAQKIIIQKTALSKDTNSKAFSLGAKAFTLLSYKSSNTAVAAVSSQGVVNITGPGDAIITITAAESEEYKGATETVKITASLAAPTIKAKNKKKNKIKLTWSRSNYADGYMIYVKGPKDKRFKLRLKKSAKVKSITHMGLKKGKKYRYKIIAYKIIKGKMVYSSPSKTVTVKVRK